MNMQWWNTVTDRIFLKEVYKDVGKHFDEAKVLDIGVEDYNSSCKTLINNPQIEYWQIDPRGFSENSDGAMHSTIQEAPDKYPESKGSFDLIFDIGVLCWNGTKFSQEEQKKYVKSISDLLKDGGIWIVHGDSLEADPEYIIDFEKNVYPHFELFNFGNYNKIETITCPNYGTVWEIKFLRKKK